MADTRVDPPTDGWSSEDVVDGAAWVDQVDEGWAEWDGGYEYVRQGRSRLKVTLAALFGLVLVGILVAGGLTLWVVRQINPPGDPGPKRTVTIDKGATTSEIADLLESRDIITNATVFRWYVSYKKAGRSRRATTSSGSVRRWGMSSTCSRRPRQSRSRT